MKYVVSPFTFKLLDISTDSLTDSVPSMVSFPVKIVLPNLTGICVGFLNTDGISTTNDIYIIIINYSKRVKSSKVNSSISRSNNIRTPARFLKNT